MAKVGWIQMLSVGFEGNRFRGEILPILDRLKEQGVIRILDLLFVRKDELGNVATMKASDLDMEEAMGFGEYIGTLVGFAAGGPEGSDRGAIAGAAALAMVAVTAVLPRMAEAAESTLGAAAAQSGRYFGAEG